MEQLKSEEIFAKEVKSSGQAFHSKYIANAGAKLQEALEKLIPAPKPRYVQRLNWKVKIQINAILTYFLFIFSDHPDGFLPQSQRNPGTLHSLKCHPLHTT